MKQITKANASYLSILGKATSAEESYRLMKYCAQLSVPEGELLFNVPTREMVLLSKEEFSHAAESEYLRAHWFFVPESTNEKQAVDKLRWVLENMQKKSGAITTYTILTTTDCNARCFYCFEKDVAHINMTEETAKKALSYIKAHSQGEKVKISWFGGEPLYNMPIIDLISRELQQMGIEFSSNMLTNGYLFDAEAVRKAKELWNLKSVQISLDGTEDVYNKSKAYIYPDGNPYHIVLENIGRLLDAGIPVSIRLNFDLYNAENLLSLVDELADRFAGKEGFSIYGHHLYDITRPSANIHSDEGWTKRYDAMHKLEDRIESRGIASNYRIRNKLKMCNCGADSGCAVMILPDGELGLCRDRLDATHIGHIEKEELDTNAIAMWKERMPQIPECDNCAYYPDCIRLKHCITTSLCFPQFRKDKLRYLQKCMRDEYNAWQKGEKAEDAGNIFEDE